MLTLLYPVSPNLPHNQFTQFNEVCFHAHEDHCHRRKNNQMRRARKGKLQIRLMYCSVHSLCSVSLIILINPSRPHFPNVAHIIVIVKEITTMFEIRVVYRREFYSLLYFQGLILARQKINFEFLKL